jgi:acetate kinase
MGKAVLALNAGSSSVKFALQEMVGETSRLLCHGLLEGLDDAPHFCARDEAGGILDERTWPDGGSHSYETLLRFLLTWVDGHGGGTALRAVGHRIVHGGGVFTAPVRLTPAVVKQLAAFTPLAPLHQPHNLAPVSAIAALRPGLPQIGCFDTAFHHTMPALAIAMPLPLRYAAQGVRRYGFHGISYEYISRQLSSVAPALARGRVIVAHLGNGASLCALRNCVSVDTTMGFTALDGLMMGTRCGAIDAGAVLYMLQHERLHAHEIERILYEQSGLLGVSGISADMRILLASDDPHAKAAIDLFVFRIVRETAALAASLGGLDGFVFTAGIGEHAREIREKVCAGLAWMGLTTGTSVAPEGGAQRLTVPESRVQAYVIPTNEEAMIVQHVIETLSEVVA